MSFGNNPENNALKVLAIVIVLAIAGYFPYKYMHRGPVEDTGRVIGVEASSQTVPLTLPLTVLTTSATVDESGPAKAFYPAILTGSISALGTGTLTKKGFQYGVGLATGGLGIVAGGPGYTYTHDISTATGLTTGSYSLGDTNPLSPSIRFLCSTTYHYRAYAVNNLGTAYGPDKTFTVVTCPGSGGKTPTDNSGTGSGDDGGSGNDDP